MSPTPSIPGSNNNCLAEFEKSRHFATFEIDGEQWSLVWVDRKQRNAEREIDFNRRQVSAYRWRLYSGLQNPWKLRDILDYRERAGSFGGREQYA
jgi:hypothetical protein